MRSYFLLERGVQTLYLFHEDQTPRPDSANLEPSEPIFRPPHSGAQVLTPLPPPGYPVYYAFGATAAFGERDGGSGSGADKLGC